MEHSCSVDFPSIWEGSDKGVVCSVTCEVAALTQLAQRIRQRDGWKSDGQAPSVLRPEPKLPADQIAVAYTAEIQDADLRVADALLAAGPFGLVDVSQSTGDSCTELRINSHSSVAFSGCIQSSE